MQINFLRLIGRSNANEEGWCQVSPVLENVVVQAAKDLPDMVETSRTGETLSVRLTATAKILLNYT